MNRQSARQRAARSPFSPAPSRVTLSITFILSPDLACLEYFQRMQSRDRKTGNSPTFYEANNKIDF